jgi:NitT/TauT family transport system substrate-binding protein
MRLGHATVALFAVVAAVWCGIARAAPDADAELVETRHEVPKLKSPAAYEPKGGVVDLELSNYAGYAGLIAENGGLPPNPDSRFTKRHGFQLRIALSEEESWNALNAGRMAGSATTADVVAVYGKQFDVTLPALIGFSRGADGIVVRSDVKRINDLRGKVLSTCQFTESDFLIRYLADEAGLGINLLDDLSAKPDPDKLNLIFCADGFGAGDLFLRDLKAGRNRLAGCVTWDPKTTEVAAGSDGKAHVMVTNRNLLVVADVLIFNRLYASAHPDQVAAIVDGLIDGNQAVRDHPGDYLPTIAKALKWDAGDAAGQLAKVHLANLPENLSFFDGTIDSAGSYGFIYQSAVDAYGKAMVPNPPDADAFTDLTALKALQRSGAYAGQVAEVVPIRSAGAGPVEDEPLLSKNIRFVFQPNSALLDKADHTNTAALADFAHLLQISPGSTVTLRGHADPSLIETYRRQGGEAMVRRVGLAAMQLSKDRASAVAALLSSQYKVDPARIKSVGKGWEDPVSKKPEENRCVELQWFTLQ